MPPSARRYLIVIVLLAVAASVAWGQRLTAAARILAAVSSPEAGEGTTAVAPMHTYFVDVEGWYSITPYETAVQSPYDLSAQSNQEMAAALPATLADWRQVGHDVNIADDPQVASFFENPTVALRRTYQDAAGHTLTLVLIGNRGTESFALFSHTPEICYPGGQWQVIVNRREAGQLDDRPMFAHYLLTQHEESGQRLAVLFWYLWDNADRDAKDGILSMRVNLYLLPGESQEAALAAAWGFVRQLLPATVVWERF